MLCGLFSQAFEEPRCRGNATHVADNGLHNHGGNFVAAVGERFFYRANRVEWQRYRRLRKTFGNAGGIRNAQRRHAGARLHQQRIDVAVITAFKLNGEIATGEAARQTQRAHRRLGTGVHQARHLH